MLCMSMIPECIMYSVACMNFCQFYLILYGRNNFVIIVLNSLNMHVICVCVCSIVV
jgi:hypothetical protein